MTLSFQDILNEAKDKMSKAVQRLEQDLKGVRTGRATPGLIDHIQTGNVPADSTVVFIHTGGLPALFAFKDEILEAFEGFDQAK